MDGEGATQRMSAQNTHTVQRLAYSKAEAAAALGVSVDYIDDHVWPELRVVRRGRLTRVPVSELQRWLDHSAARTLD
jgi:hypothetical protein